MYCPYCGKSNPDFARFCVNCGKSLCFAENEQLAAFILKENESQPKSVEETTVPTSTAKKLSEPHKEDRINNPYIGVRSFAGLLVYVSLMGVFIDGPNYTVNITCGILAPIMYLLIARSPFTPFRICLFLTVIIICSIIGMEPMLMQNYYVGMFDIAVVISHVFAALMQKLFSIELTQ